MPRIVRCADCGQQGHYRRNCPNGPLRDKTCLKCGITRRVSEFRFYTYEDPRNCRYGDICCVCQELRGRCCHRCGQVGHRINACPMPDDGLYWCARCRFRLPLVNYKLRKSGNPLSYCRTCSTWNRDEKRKDLNWLFGRMLKSGQKAMDKRNLPTAIDPDFLIQLLERQQWICHYSGIEMTTDCGDWAISIDRKDSLKGYVAENVVLCCWRCNQMKQDLDDEQFLTLCRIIHENNAS